MSAKSQKSVRIDLISDVVCPWCIVGYKQLEQAIAKTDVAVELYWHPFELNPDMAAGGQDLLEHVVEKYGVSKEDSAATRQRLTELGAELGFTFKYSDTSLMYNTFKAHQMLAWADEHDLQHKLKMALFAAYFTDGKNIDEDAVLADAAASVGLDRDEALKHLADGTYEEQIVEEEEFWRNQGITSVPAVVVNQEHLVSGAQGVDNFVQMLKELGI